MPILPPRFRKKKENHELERFSGWFGKDEIFPLKNYKLEDLCFVYDVCETISHGKVTIRFTNLLNLLLWPKIRGLDGLISALHA